MGEAGRYAIRKQGPIYDLPIALSVPAASGHILPETVAGTRERR